MRIIWMDVVNCFENFQLKTWQRNKPSSTANQLRGSSESSKTFLGGWYIFRFPLKISCRKIWVEPGASVISHLLNSCQMNFGEARTRRAQSNSEFSLSNTVCCQFYAHTNLPLKDCERHSRPEMYLLWVSYNTKKHGIYICWINAYFKLFLPKAVYMVLSPSVSACSVTCLSNPWIAINQHGLRGLFTLMSCSS